MKYSDYKYCIENPDLYLIYDSLHYTQNVDDIIMMRIEGRDVIYFRHSKLNLYFGLTKSGNGQLTILSSIKNPDSNIINNIKRLIRQCYITCVTYKVLFKLGLNPTISGSNYKVMKCDGAIIEVSLDKIRIASNDAQLINRIIEIYDMYGVKLQEYK